MTDECTINVGRVAGQFLYQVAVDCSTSVSMRFPAVRPRAACLFEYNLSMLITLKMEATGSSEMSVKTVPCLFVCFPGVTTHRGCIFTAW